MSSCFLPVTARRETTGLANRTTGRVVQYRNGSHPGLSLHRTIARTPEFPIVVRFRFRFRLARRFSGPAASLAIAAMMTPASAPAVRAASRASEPMRRSSGAVMQIADGAELLQPDGGPEADRP